MAVLTGCWVMDLVVLLTSSVLIYWLYIYSSWWRRGVPFKWPLPLVGNAGPFILQLMSPAELVKRNYQHTRGHKVVGVYRMLTPSLEILDPEIIRHILVKDFAHFSDRGMYFDEQLEPLSAHLFNLTGQRWKSLRVKLTPTFTSGKMKMMFPTVRECGLELVEEMKKSSAGGEPVEVRDLVARYATDVIASCAFGIQGNSLKNPNAEFRKWGRKALEPSLSNVIRMGTMIIFPSLGPLFKLRNFPEAVTTFFRGVVAETLEYRENNGVSRNDFMQLLIQLKNNRMIDDDAPTEEAETQQRDANVMADAAGLTVDEVAAQAFIFYLAGFETSSTAMSFCLYELALHPEIQDRVREEVDAVIERHGGQLTYEGLQEMEYLDHAVLETLRKYPPVPVINRKCTQRYSVPGTNVVLEPGELITVPSIGLHHDPEYFPDPERFDPDRFTEEAVKARPHYTYLPFGEGPRICIGMRFAMMQTKAGLALLLSRVHFSVCSKTPIPIVFDTRALIMVARGGQWLRVTERQH